MIILTLKAYFLKSAFFIMSGGFWMIADNFPHFHIFFHIHGQKNTFDMDFIFLYHYLSFFLLFLKNML